MTTGLPPPDRGQAMIAGRPFTAWPNPSHVAGALLGATTRKIGEYSLRTSGGLLS